jgi:hypothetical protein
VVYPSSYTITFSVPHIAQELQIILIFTYLLQVLTLYQGKMTTGRRSSPIPQLKCVGGSAQGQFNPEVTEYNGILQAVFGICQYFSRIRIHGSIILKYGCESWRPINYGFVSYLDIFVATEKIYRMLPNG